MKKYFSFFSELHVLFDCVGAIIFLVDIAMNVKMNVDDNECDRMVRTKLLGFTIEEMDESWVTFLMRSNEKVL